VFVSGGMAQQVVQSCETLAALVASVSFEPLVLGDMRFVVRCSREAVGTYLADERFDRQVDLCVLS